MLAAIQMQYATIVVRANQNGSNEDVRRKLLFLWFDVEHKTFPILVSQNKLNYFRCRATPNDFGRDFRYYCVYALEKYTKARAASIETPFCLVEKSNQLQKIQLTFRLLNKMMSKANICKVTERKQNYLAEIQTAMTT